MIGYQPSPYLQVYRAAAVRGDTNHASSLVNTSDRLIPTASLMPHFSFISLETNIRYCCHKRGPYTIDTSAIRLPSILLHLYSHLHCHHQRARALPSSLEHSCFSLSRAHDTTHDTTHDHIENYRRPFLCHHKLPGRYSVDSVRAATAHNVVSLPLGLLRPRRAHRRVRTLQHCSVRVIAIHGFPEHSLITKPSQLINSIIVSSP